jgi:hypothetical protein
MDNINTNTNTNTNTNEPYIRPPDPDIQETLSYFDPDDELNSILELSKVEYNLYMKQQEQLIEDICKEDKERIEEQTKERTNQFKSIKQKVKNLLSFDKQHTNKYEIILSIIEMYEQDFITVYTVTKEDYDTLFEFLQSLRITNTEIENFKRIINID